MRSSSKGPPALYVAWGSHRSLWNSKLYRWWWFWAPCYSTDLISGLGLLDSTDLSNSAFATEMELGQLLGLSNFTFELLSFHFNTTMARSPALGHEGPQLSWPLPLPAYSKLSLGLMQSHRHSSCFCFLLGDEPKLTVWSYQVIWVCQNWFGSWMPLAFSHSRWFWWTWICIGRYLGSECSLSAQWQIPHHSHHHSPTLPTMDSIMNGPWSGSPLAWPQ